MSMSESEVSSSSSASASKSSEDEEVYDCQFHPYENEPLAEPDDGENYESLDENEDLDGLTPAILEARYERKMNVDSW